MSEVWKPVVGFEGAYEVSDQGRVRSLDRVVEAQNRWGSTTRYVKRGRVLRPLTNHARGGYRYANLRVDGQQSLRRVSVLVAAAFLGPRPEGQQVRHKNGVASDDRLSNLVYGTPAENAADKLLHGTHHRGERHPRAKLSEADVLSIRASSASRLDIAEKYAIDPRHVDSIRARRRWSHV